MKTPLTFTKKFLIIFARILAMTTPIWGVTFLAIVGLSWVFAGAEQVNFGDALYFGCVTALTIGYGDIAPATATGKTVSVLMGILGVITTGVIVACALQAMKITYDAVIEEAKKRLKQVNKS